MSKEKPKRIHLKNVRLSFPSVFKRAVFDGKEGKFEATFLIPKSNVELKKILDKEIAKAVAKSGIKINADKYCLKDGDNSDYDGYAGNWSLKASNNKRPTVLNKEGEPTVEDDNVIYAGCHVYAIIDFWIQNNNFGKRVNANLYGIKFFKDGDPFGSGPIDVTDDFDDFDEEDEDEGL